MIFTPFEPEEKKPTLDEGIYNAVCIKAVDGHSKAGNPMITLTVKIYYQDKEAFLYDYILPNFKSKFVSFVTAIGKKSSLEKGELNEFDCVGVMFKVVLKNENSETKIVKYIQHEANSENESNETKEVAFDDALPF